MGAGNGGGVGDGTENNSHARKFCTKCYSLSKSTTASHACGTKVSEEYGGIDKDQTKYPLQGVRVIQRKDLHVSKKCIRHSVFGNCFIGKLAHGAVLAINFCF